jgi:PAS domain-containing protein
MEATGLGIWEMAPEMENLRCNDQCLALLGLSPGCTLDYDTFLHALHPDDRARVHEAWSATREGSARSCGTSSPTL